MILLLRFGLIKSRFHNFRGRKLNISWFLNVLMCLWASKPVLFIFGETRIPQKILESIWNHHGKILSMEIWDPTFSKKSKPKPSLFWIYFLYLFFGSIFWIYIFLNIYLENNFAKMRNWKWFISINKIHKSLDMNFVCVKKH